MSAKDEWQYKYNKSHNTLQCRPCGWLDGWMAIPPDKWINKIYNNMFHVQDINVGGQEAEGRRHHQSSNAELSWVMATFEAIASSLLLLLLLLLWWPLRVVCPVLGNTHIIWFYSNESYLGDRNWSLQWNEVEWSGVEWGAIKGTIDGNWSIGHYGHWQFHWWSFLRLLYFMCKSPSTHTQGADINANHSFIREHNMRSGELDKLYRSSN